MMPLIPVDAHRLNMLQYIAKAVLHMMPHRAYLIASWICVLLRFSSALQFPGMQQAVAVDTGRNKAQHFISPHHTSARTTVVVS
jgi:hypothetical protein